MGDSKTIAVDTEQGVVTVHKMALGDYAQLLRALNKLPTILGDIVKKEKSELTTDYLIGVLPSVMADGLPELAGVLAATTDKDADFIMSLDLADATEIVDAALQLNDFSRIVASVKKMQGRFQKPASKAAQA